MKVIVLGDGIYDLYRKFSASRLCPEAPVPVGIKENRYGTPGGAGLVAEQFTALTNDNTSALSITGSYSVKERIFLDDHLIVRLDDDSQKIQLTPGDYLAVIEHYMNEYKPDAIIVSDYGKGAFIEPVAQWLVRRADDLNIPVFVDAKNNFEWYAGAFAAFPNEKETAVFADFKHVIQKLGSNGACVDAVHIPTNSHPVRDTTGAGDCFIAAFVYKWIEGLHTVGVYEHEQLMNAARFANKVAGISVEYVGTHAVSLDEIKES